MENIRQRAERQNTISIHQAYKSIDWLSRGFITATEIVRGFDLVNQRYQGSPLDGSLQRRLDSDEIECFIRRFNKDKLNGRIS